MKISVKRRDLLKFGVFGSAIALTGCATSHENTLSSEVWDPAAWLVFTAAESNVSVDLSLTLPTRIRPGGAFSLAPTSNPLPPGVSLSAQGILTLVNPIEGITKDIIFTYAEPAA